MFVKVIIWIFLLLIVFNLGSGLYYLLKEGGRSNRTVKSLSWRIGLSAALFILLLLGFATGIITPHAGPML